MLRHTDYRLLQFNVLILQLDLGFTYNIRTMQTSPEQNIGQTRKTKKYKQISRNLLTRASSATRTERPLSGRRVCSTMDLNHNLNSTNQKPVPIYQHTRTPAQLRLRTQDRPDSLGWPAAARRRPKPNQNTSEGPGIENPTGKLS